MESIFETVSLACFSVFQFLLLSPLLLYLIAGCGVCDTSAGSDDPELHENALPSQSRDSSGFDINPAMSPVFERMPNESSSGFDWNVLGCETREWWNVKILGEREKTMVPGCSATI